VNTNNEFILVKESVAKAIYSITPFTLLDYPHKTACILWFAGCNMRCLYCYNPEIVLGKGKITFDEALLFLNSRKNLLDGVVLSGGECTSHKGLVPFLQKIKAMGFSVKIDTNGSNPQILSDLINRNLIDYVALDFKALPDKFNSITQSNLFENFNMSLQFLLQYKVNFELRTTYHSELLNENDLNKMIQFLESQNYVGHFFIQHFINNVETIGNLEDSKKNIQAAKFSTRSIKVDFR
jgi:pyruvate formate lyase activating enzyme